LGIRSGNMDKEDLALIKSLKSIVDSQYNMIKVLENIVKVDQEALKKAFDCIVNIECRLKIIGDRLKVIEDKQK